MQSSSMETSTSQNKLALPGKPIDIGQLATFDLQLLAAARGHKSAWQRTRAAVLAMISGDVLRAEKLRAGANIWQVENAKVVHKPTTMR